MKKREGYIVKGVVLVLSFLIISLVYNVFFLPNELVVGGLSGISILTNKLYNIDPSIFIFVVNIFLLVISFLILGKSKTINSLFGALFFPLMIALSKPIAAFLIPYLTFNDFWLVVIISAMLHGLALGLIFKTGFSTGGTDILVQILSKYIKITEGKAMLFINVIIIILASITFGVTKAIYAIIVLIINAFIFDKVLFEQSNSKVFYIYTKKTEEIKHLIKEEFQTGFTLLPTIGGYSHEKGELVMCVLPNREYYSFKTRVLDIDEAAFFVIVDCYESQGGFKKKNIPYI